VRLPHGAHGTDCNGELIGIGADIEGDRRRCVVPTEPRCSDGSIDGTADPQRDELREVEIGEVAAVRIGTNIDNELMIGGHSRRQRERDVAAPSFRRKSSAETAAASRNTAIETMRRYMLTPSNFT
jgi:hypothetical protein